MAVHPVDQEGVDDFTGLFVGHYQQLLRLAVLFLGDLPAAEDVVQEAFIRVHGALRRRRVDDPVAYLRQTVVNLSRSDLRRRLVARRHASKPMPDAAGAEDDACLALRGWRLSGRCARSRSGSGRPSCCGTGPTCRRPVLPG